MLARGRDDETVSVKHSRRDVKWLMRALSTQVVARDAVASRVEEASNSGSAANKAGEFTRIKVVDQLERPRRVVGRAKNSLSNLSFTVGHWEAEE
jgi:hypothetical protein